MHTHPPRDSVAPVEQTESSQMQDSGSRGAEGEEAKEKDGAKMEVNDDDPEPEVINVSYIFCLSCER